MIENENGKFLFTFWSVLFTICLIVMLWFASVKTIEIDGSFQERVEGQKTFGHGIVDRTLHLEQVDGYEKKICIPLPKGVKAEQIMIENRYDENLLVISFATDDMNFYDQTSIYGALEWITEACWEPAQQQAALKFTMDRMLEYRSLLEGNLLTVSFLEPRELYSYIVVIDPAGGGTEYGTTVGGVKEKDIALQIAKMVQKQMNQEKVKVYLTRSEDRYVSKQDRKTFLETVDADFYVGIRTQVDKEDSENYGILGFYDEEYFFADLKNVDFADLVARNVTISCSNRAIGLKAVEDANLLKGLKIRGTQLSVGFLSNEKERALLGQEVYLEKIAAGINRAILEACERLSSDSLD